MVRTYSVDSTGYYLGQGDELTVRVYAANTQEARDKALKLRSGDQMSGTHNAWRAVVTSAEEMQEIAENKHE